MTDLEGATVQKGIFVPCDVLRALQGRDLRLRALDHAVLQLDRELRDTINRVMHEEIEDARRSGAERRPRDYFVVDASATRRAEILMGVRFPTSDGKEGTPPSKLDEAMEAATINAENPAIISIRRDHQALLDRLRDQNKHLEASDRHRDQLERRIVKLENSGSSAMLVRRVEQLEGIVEKLRAAISALRGMAL